MPSSDRKLYLIPSTLGDSPVSKVIPTFNLEIIQSISHFVVEEERTARRFLIKCGYKNDIGSVQFYTLNEHTASADVPAIFVNSGINSLGLLSEAGLPGIADPGALLVEEAHRLNIQVIPLSGPSSLFMALMASGMNGQQFAFNGYLPVKGHERLARIRFFEKRSESEKQSQLFIEAPYRNDQLLLSFLEALRPSTRLCIAVNISLDEEWICTKTIHDWKKQPLPDLKRKPAVFIIMA
jgi:16S rRNA (cytidine1402-2'-O)-methyltransferase